MPTIKGRAAGLAKAKKLKKLRNTEGTKEQAKYLNSAAGLTVGTIKGLPAAAKKVGKAIVKSPGKVLGYLEGKSKKINAAKRNRNSSLIMDNFGSVDAYDKMMMDAQKKIKNK